MEKYDWKTDTELWVWLCDSTPAPKAVTGPKFYSVYKFVIEKKHVAVEVKNFVPEWALPVVCRMLDNDSTVKDYFYECMYKGNIRCS